MHSHTYAGNPLGCSAGIAVLDILKEDKIIETAQKRAIYFNNIINEKFSSHENVGEVRHLGLINAIEIVKNKKTKESFDSKLRLGYQIYKKALKKGVLLRPLGDVIYFNPPLIIEENDMDFVTDVAKECMIEVINS
jgi:adenosylmethionine-8-amino-7-oxononanoate aminotransferase